MANLNYSNLEIHYINILSFKGGFLYMYLEALNRIVFDNEMNVISCLSDEYVCAAMTVEDILEIVPNIKKIMEAKCLSEIEAVTNDLIYELPLNEESIEKWEKCGLNEVERFLIALAYSAARLEELRYHLCHICNTEYFSTDDMSDICDKCLSRYNHI